MKKLFLNIALASIFGFAAGIALGAGVVTKTVTAEGTGPTRAAAIQAALNEAVAEATGLSINTVTHTEAATSSFGTSTMDADKNKEKTTSNLAESVKSSTGTEISGNVKGYSVTDIDTAQNGTVTAKIEADIAVYQGDSQSNRRRIAVLPFAYKGTSEAVAEYDKRMRQGIVDYLTSTRHFAVLDRDFTQDRLNELESLLRPDVKIEDRARYGNSLGTDYIVVGDINLLDLKKGKEKVPFTNEIVDSMQGPLSYTWRVIEAATGQILLSKSEDKKLKVKDDLDLYVKGAGEGKQIGTILSDVIYPIIVIDFDNNDRLTLAQGGSTLKEGDKYRLVRYGKIQVDPYTGEKIAREEIPVGDVQITDVTPKLAHAQVLNSTVDLRDMGPREYILRAYPPEEKSAKPRPKTMTPNW
ncbi:MAG: hypothetical protein LUC43_03630 [Burkholderiales bacterium]|nr:hypothetical protein [Burkholderiales bacterium]